MMELIKKALLLRREILLEDMLLTQANDPHVDRRVANLQGFCRGIDAIIDFDSLLNSLDSVVDIYDTGD